MTVSGSDTAHCIASAGAIIISAKTDCIADVEVMESTLQVAASPSNAGDAMVSIAAVSAKKEREEDEKNVVELNTIKEAEVNDTVCIRVKLTDGSIKCFDFDDVAKINEAVSNLSPILGTDKPVNHLTTNVGLNLL